MGYRSHPWAPRAVWPAYRGLQRHRLRKARAAATDPAFLNGDRPWVESSSLLNGRLFLSRAARERVVTQRSMNHRYATKIPVGCRVSLKILTATEVRLEEVSPGRVVGIPRKCSGELCT